MRCHGTFLFLFKQNSDAARYLNGRLYERNDHGIFTGCCLNFRDHDINDSLGILSSADLCNDNPYKCCITSDDQDLICLKDHQPYIKRRTFFKTMQNARRCDQVFAQRSPKCPVRRPADSVDDPSSR